MTNISRHCTEIIARLQIDISKQLAGAGSEKEALAELEVMRLLNDCLAQIIKLYANGG